LHLISAVGVFLLSRLFGPFRVRLRRFLFSRSFGPFVSFLRFSCRYLPSRDSRCSCTVPFRPGVQSHITPKETDGFKIHHKSKEKFSAFSKSKFSEIVQPRQHKGYLLDGVIRFDETHLEDPHLPGPCLRGFGASLCI